MKSAAGGRRVFGVSAVFFGAIAWLWHDSATWQNIHHIWSLPLGAVLGDGLMAAQIAGGIGIQNSRTARPASVALSVVYLCFALACVPDIVATQNVYEKYGGSFFLFLSLFFAAVALYAAEEPNGGRRLAFGHLARIGLGVCAISFALEQGLLLRATANAVPTWIPAGQMFWAVLTTVAFALAAIVIHSLRCA